jgi:peptidoglycan hydrolase-like protein with peptidoglycan-binding domain
MQLVTRAEWGAQPPKQAWTYVVGTRGVKVHYEGAPVPTDLPAHHEWCAGRVRDIQAAHMSDPTEGWIDIAYNAVICPHGYVFEGRGPHHETGANGNQPLNLAHYAVCGMVGDSGLTQPTDDMLNGLRDAIDWLRQQGGAGGEILGHRDGYPTDCPGDPLYAWVRAGAPRPGGSGAGGGGTGSASGAPSWPGEYLVVQDPPLHDDNVRIWQQRMADRGWSIAVDGWYGDRSAAVCRQFQQEHDLQADGVVGPVTWDASWTAPIT